MPKTSFYAVQAVSGGSRRCFICQSTDHLALGCPSLLFLAELGKKPGGALKALQQAASGTHAVRELGVDVDDANDNGSGGDDEVPTNSKPA